MITKGIYQAKGIQIGFKEIASRQDPICQVECFLGRCWKEGKWEPINPAERFVCEKFLFKANGDVSDFNWKMMQDVFGWDGVSLETLQALDISKTYFNVTIDLNEDGYLEAKFLNQRNDTPSTGAKKEVKKLDPSKLRRFAIKPAVDLSYPGDVPPIREDDVPF